MAGKVAIKKGNEIETSFVLKYFEAFYYVVLKEKERIESGGWLSTEQSTDTTPGAMDSVYAQQAQEILDKLYQLLTEQAIEASRYGGEFASNYYREAQYVMTALADEVFLNIQWPGRRYWEENLLESRLFGTHDAGDLFFQNLENFLNTRDSLRNDLAEIYLLALGLGFLGKFRGYDDQGKIAAYKHQLYIFINHRESQLFDKGEAFFPEAYMYTLEKGDIRTIQDMKYWMLSIGGIFLIILIASFFVWYHDTADLYSATQRILDLTGK